MRVISGTAKSLRLQVPRGVGIRPTTDAMRESLFGSLGERVVGARFADLYAGAGSVGIEALSRGAEVCVFVEQDARCIRALEANLEATGLTGGGRVVRGRVERVWRRVWQEWGPFDVVFADPPYGLAGFADVARRLAGEGEGVAESGLVVIQCETERDLPGLREPDRVRRFGETQMRHYEDPRAGLDP